MRCKVGDLAVVIFGDAWVPDNVRPMDGSVVKVERFVGTSDDQQKDGAILRVHNGWEVKSCLVPTGCMWIVSDAYLYPIRPPEQPVQIGQLEDLREPV